MNPPETQPFAPVLAKPDRRHHPRYTVQVQIELHEEGNDLPLHVETTDLSRGGCYVQLMMPLSVGRRISAKLWLDGESMTARACVVTRHPAFGNGIMFLEFEGDGEKRLKRYLEAVVA